MDPEGIAFGAKLLWPTAVDGVVAGSTVVLSYGEICSEL